MSIFKTGLMATVVAVMAGSSLVAVPVQAQDSAEEESVALEEVLVTATKRLESLQDVPISIGVVTGEIIQEMNIQNLIDLQAFVPSFTVQSTFGNWAIRIRGVGSGQTNMAFSSSVSIFNDGVYCGRSRCLEGGYLDVDRVEVARGPQGALFGKSTIAGAVNVISERPTEEAEGYLRAGYEFEDDGYSASAMASGPLTENLRYRVAIKTEKIGGYFHNTFLDTDEPEVKKSAFRGSLAWDATEDVTFNLKYEVASKDEDGNPNQLVTGGLFSIWGADPGNEFKKDDIRNVATGTSLPEFDDMDSSTLTLRMDANLGEHTLTAIASNWELDYENHLDVDGTPAFLLTAALGEDYDQQSLEVRLLSPSDGNFEYTVGALYHQSDVKIHQTSGYPFLQHLAPVPFGLFDILGYDRNYAEDSEAWSIYGQLTWHASDRLRVIVDARYTEEEKDGNAWLNKAVYLPPDLLAGPDDGGFFIRPRYNLSETREDEHFDPSLRIQYDVSDDIMVYAAYATGSKAGGMKCCDQDMGLILLGKDDAWFQKYAGRSVTPEELAAGATLTLAQGNGVLDYEDEEADSFEVGAKMMLADGRVSFNIAAFTMQFDNLQTSSYDGTRFIIGNAASATIDGIEVEANWQVTDSLRLFGALSWLDATYDKWPSGQCLVADEAGNFRDPDCVNGQQDMSGVKLERTPDKELTLSANWEMQLTDTLMLNTLASMYYSDEISIRQDFHPLGIQDSYTKWDLRLALSPVERQWEVALLGRNLSDEMVIQHAYEILGANFVALENGRTITLEGTWRF